MKLFLLIALFGIACAQEDVERIAVKVEWPGNDDTNGGAIVAFSYTNIGNGSCVVSLPGPVRLFHAMNVHVVPGDETDPSDGRFKLTAPAEWEASNGTINVLIIFKEGDFFNKTATDFRCDAGDEEILSVYSFPQNVLMQEASSNVHYKPGFHVGDKLTITLPFEVTRFNFTGGDSEWIIESEGLVHSVSGFKNEEGVDDQKEVHFSLEYDIVEEEVGWFSAGSVIVDVYREKTE